LAKTNTDLLVTNPKQVTKFNKLEHTWNVQWQSLGEKNMGVIPPPPQVSAFLAYSVVYLVDVPIKVN